MTLWLIFALMTAVAIFAVALPLARRGSFVHSGSDIAIYRDQLEEIDRDLAAGTIEEGDAQAARIEVSRRLLAASDAAKTAPSNPETPSWYRPTVAIVSFLLLTVGTFSLYVQLGSPGLVSDTKRGAPIGQQAGIEDMVAKVEAHLQSNPKDGRGWEVLAPVYMKLGRYSDSVTAWRNALALLGENADRQADLGEALVANANGDVTAEAKSAFARAMTIDNTNVVARFYLGLAAEQDGKREEAARIWRGLAADAPPGAPWLVDVRTALARVDSSPAPSLPGPNAGQVAAAGQMSADQQNAMIRSMVARLADRLKKDGSDIDGWLQLVRSYVVLGERDKAASAASDARQAIGNDAAKRQRLDDFVKSLGLNG